MTDETTAAPARLTGVERLEAFKRRYLGEEDAKRGDNDGLLRECDTDHNDLSRELIAEYRLAHGRAFLVMVNRHGEKEKAGSPVWEWDGGLVYNFGADAVLPAFDAELERLLLENERAATLAGALPRIEAIYARIEAVGGCPLSFS